VPGPGAPAGLDKRLLLFPLFRIAWLPLKDPGPAAVGDRVEDVGEGKPPGRATRSGSGAKDALQTGHVPSVHHCNKHSMWKQCWHLRGRIPYGVPMFSKQALQSRSTPLLSKKTSTSPKCSKLAFTDWNHLCSSSSGARSAPGDGLLAATAARVLMCPGDRLACLTAAVSRLLGGDDAMLGTRPIFTEPPMHVKSSGTVATKVSGFTSPTPG